MPADPSPVDPDMPVDGADAVSVPEMAEDMLPTAPLSRFWQEAQLERMVMADGVVRDGVLHVRFLTLLPNPDEPRTETFEGIVSDLDAENQVFSLLDFPELKLDFASSSYALAGETVSADVFWADLREDDWVILTGVLTADAAGNQVLEVTRVNTFDDPMPPPPPPLFATEGIVQSFDSDTKTVRLLDVPALTITVPDDALYITERGESNGAQFWREVQMGDGIFVEGLLQEDRLIVQFVERFDRDCPQVVSARVLDLDRAARQFALDSAPDWLVNVSANSEYSNADGEVLTADAFWDTLTEGDNVTVSGTLNAAATVFVADSITLTRRPNVHTLEGTITQVEPSRQQFTLAEVPEITVQISDKTRFAVETNAPITDPSELIDSRQWLEPATFVIVSGILEGNTLLAQDIIIFFEPIFSERPANVLELDVSVNPGGWVTVAMRGELPDPCTQLARIEQAFAGNTITLTVITRTDTSRACEDVVVPFSEQVQLERQLSPGTYTLNVNQQTITLTVSDTTDPERLPAFVETVDAQLLDNEREVQLDITGFLSSPCHVLAGYDVTVKGGTVEDSTVEGGVRPDEQPR